MSRWPGNAQREQTTFGELNRGQLMSRVHSTGNQTTEMQLARLLRKARLTGWRRHSPLPGRPDFVWPKMKLAVFRRRMFLARPQLQESHLKDQRGSVAGQNSENPDPGPARESSTPSIGLEGYPYLGVPVGQSPSSLSATNKAQTLREHHIRCIRMQYYAILRNTETTRVKVATQGVAR